nr:hypothetical protein [Serendipita indica]
MYGAINPPTTPGRTFADFAAAVPNADEPGFGVTAPFTPTTGSASGSASGGASSTSGAGSSPSASSTSTTTPNGASVLSARSSVAVVLAGVAASLLL